MPGPASMPLLAVSTATAELLWWISLGVFVVVLLVVAALLQAIVGAARRIRSKVGGIWTVGKLIANNTVQIATLGRINQLAAEVVTTAGDIHSVLERIEAHAEGCPGCPRCVTGAGRSGDSSSSSRSPEGGPGPWR